MTKEKTAEELTLLLLYLTSWEEGIDKIGKYLKNWKNHQFDILDALTEKGYVNNNKKHKSLIITKIGEEKARELLKKYNID